CLIATATSRHVLAMAARRLRARTSAARRMPGVVIWPSKVAARNKATLASKAAARNKGTLANKAAARNKATLANKASRAQVQAARKAQGLRPARRAPKEPSRRRTAAPVPRARRPAAHVRKARRRTDTPRA